jgi:hypothetical protein
MAIDLDITNIENDIYPCDLLIFYCDNNQINNFKYQKLQLPNYTFNKYDFKNLLSSLQIDDYYPKYILEFYIDNQLNDIIDYYYDNDTNDIIYNYKLNIIKDIDDIVFTNTHFLNTLIIILDNKLAKKQSKKHIDNYNNCTRVRNRNVKNTTKKIKIKKEN